LIGLTYAVAGVIAAQLKGWQRKVHHRNLAAFELDAIPLQRLVPAVCSIQRKVITSNATGAHST
jgi:hypothetical protein